MKPYLNPCCGYRCDARDELDDVVRNVESKTSPTQGDLMICLNCGAVLVYLDPATNLTRPARLTDILKLPEMSRATLAAAVAYVRKRGWLPSEAQRIKGN